MHSTLPEVLFDEVRIRQRVEELALEISGDYAEVDELILVGVLRGCYIFLADLSRLLTVSRRIDFISVSSYGNSTVSTGAVRMVLDLRLDIRGKHVLIVDDILDSGYTMQYLVKLFLARQPASLKTCALLHKQGRQKVDITLDYRGFDIADIWVVGYGLDCGDKFRALPYIGRVDPTPFPD
ncbi:MAG: hypoxanthine phosphoribosyltransferase [Syntrophotaleaceae bacterium]